MNYLVLDHPETVFYGWKFTSGGHPIGGIGEMVAAHMFKLMPYPNPYPAHDAVTGTGNWSR